MYTFNLQEAYEAYTCTETSGNKIIDHQVRTFDFKNSPRCVKCEKISIHLEHPLTKLMHNINVINSGNQRNGK